MSKSKRKIASYTGRRSRGFSVRDLTRVALMTAILAVCGWITIPLPEPMVPFTLQTFGVFLCLLLLGGRDGTLAIAAYLLLGAVGAPVFSSFRGGLGVLLGSTGGYLTGFLAITIMIIAVSIFGTCTIYINDKLVIASIGVSKVCIICPSRSEKVGFSILSIFFLYQ